MFKSWLDSLQKLGFAKMKKGGKSQAGNGCGLHDSYDTFNFLLVKTPSLKALDKCFKKKNLTFGEANIYWSRLLAVEYMVAGWQEETLI